MSTQNSAVSTQPEKKNGHKREPQITGWIVNDGSVIALNKPCEAIHAGTFRPSTGMIKSLSFSGEGELIADNGQSNDGVIILTNSAATAESITAFCLWAGEKFSLTGIPDGDYLIFFALGSNEHTYQLLLPPAQPAAQVEKEAP